MRRVLRHRQPDGYVNSGAPFYRQRANWDTLFGGDTWFAFNGSKRLTWNSRENALFSPHSHKWQHPMWGAFTVNYAFNGSATNGDTLVVTGGSSGLREGSWAAGWPGKIATAQQTNAYPGARIGFKQAAWQFEVTETLIANGGTPVVLDTTTNVVGEVLFNATDWTFSWFGRPSMTILQPVPTKVVSWNDWDNWTLTDAGSVVDGGVTYSWTLSLTLNLTRYGE